MSLALNHDRLQHLINNPFPVLSANELQRRDTVFFIGGNLPVYETMETMYESHCQESSDLFHVTFAERNDLERNLELVRQIKKNFSVRLMGRVACEIPVSLLEPAYLAGLDLLDIPCFGTSVCDTRKDLWRSAVKVFPRWSVVSSLSAGTKSTGELKDSIDKLLAIGVVPLPAMISDESVVKIDQAADMFEYLIAAWQRHEVQIKPLLPFIRLVTPLESSEQAGFIRNVFNRIQDKHLLATSDLRRHLRTSGAEASFESAGL